MKHVYESAKIEITELYEPDIITTSGGDGWLSGDDKPNHDVDGWT